MIIGLDFDNTIVDYSKIFSLIAKEQGLKLQNGVSPKDQVKSHILKKSDGNLEWTKLQGEVYGKRISGACCYRGIKKFLRDQSANGCRFVIISHKSIFPSLTSDVNLHETAREFLNQNGFFSEESINLSINECFFEQTLECKINRIISCRCNVFVDDLISVLKHTKFPKSCFKIHFSSGNESPQNENHLASADSWRIVSQRIPSLEQKNQDTETSGGESKFNLNSFFRANKLGTISSRRKLDGGINSNLIKVRNTKGNSYCVKIYKKDFTNPSRFEKETLFIKRISPLMPDSIPRVIASDPTNQIAILNFVEGKLVSKLNKCPTSIWRSFNRFVLDLQKHKRLVGKQLYMATDCALSLSQHHGILQKRRDEWLVAISNGMPSSIIDLVSEFLLWPYDKISQKLLSSPAFHEMLSYQELIISPSDFGEHNAILNNDKVVFIDFEYAGLDDPAKLVSDYYCHPQNRVSPLIVRHLVKDLMEGFDQSQRLSFMSRLEIIFEIIKLKWCFIIMKPLIKNTEIREIELVRKKIKSLMCKTIDKIKS